MELRDYLRILRKRWREVLLIFLVVVTIYSAYLKVGRKLPYKSTATMQIAKTPIEYGFMFAENAPSIPIYSYDAKVRLFTSRAVSEEAAEALAKDFPITSQTIRASVTAVANRDEQTVELAAVYEEPDQTQHILEALGNATIETDKKVAASYYEEQEKALTVAKTNRETERDQIVRRFQYLNAELERNGLYLPEEQVGARLGFVGGLENTKIRLQLDLRRLEAEKKAGASGWLLLAPRFPDGQAAPNVASQADAVLSNLNQRLVGIEADLARMRNKYTDAHPRVIEAESERKAVEKAIQDIASRPPGPGEASRIDAEIAITNNEIAFLDDAIRERGKELISLSRKRTEYREVERDLQRATDGVESIDKQLTQIQIQKGGVKSMISWDVKPGLGQPFGKTGFESLPFAALIALVLGISGGYTIEYLNNTIRTSQDVKVYLSLPTISTMPLFDGGQPNLLTAATQTPEWELFNRLSTLLEAVALEQRARTFLVTSVKAEEGKSTLACNIAIALAQGGERVVLVDCDMRNPSCHQFFSMENTRGLSNLLSGEGEGDASPTLSTWLRPTPAASLGIVTSGPIPANPVSLLKSPRMSWLLSEIKKTGAIAIFDSPPVLELTDPAILATLLDVTILVLAEDFVSRREAVQAKHILTQVGANIAGVVMNKGTHEPAEYYYYRYSRYARYGRYGRKTRTTP